MPEIRVPKVVQVARERIGGGLGKAKAKLTEFQAVRKKERAERVAARKVVEPVATGQPNANPETALRALAGDAVAAESVQPAEPTKPSTEVQKPFDESLMQPVSEVQAEPQAQTSTVEEQAATPAQPDVPAPTTPDIPVTIPENLDSRAQAKLKLANAQAEITTRQAELKELPRITDVEKQYYASKEQELGKLRENLPTLIMQAMDHKELVQKLSEGLSEQFQERFAREKGIKGWIENAFRSGKARHEIAQMNETLGLISAEESLSDDQRAMLEQAYVNGSVVNPKFEKDMGIILGRIRLEKGSLRNRIPILGGRFKNSPEQEMAIAQEQLRALTGQMKEKELQKYDKSILRLLWNILAVMLASALPEVVSVGSQAVSAETQAQR